MNAELDALIEDAVVSGETGVLADYLEDHGKPRSMADDLVGLRRVHRVFRSVGVSMTATADGFTTGMARAARAVDRFREAIGLTSTNHPDKRIRRRERRRLKLLKRSR